MAATKPNPKHLALWSIAGAFVAASAFFLTFLPIPHVAPSHPGLLALNWANRLRWIVFLLPLTSGFTVWYVADRRFRRGFADGIWSETELERVRTVLGRSVWGWTFAALAVGALLMVSFSRTHSGVLVYIVTLPMHTLSNLRGLLSPPKERNGLLDWRNSKPLRSDHWGELHHEEHLPS